MEALHKNNRLFYKRLKVPKNTMTVLTKATFNDLQALKMLINGYADYLEELDNSLKSFLKETNQPLHIMYDTSFQY